MTAMEPPATKHTHEVQDSSEEHVVGHGSSSAEGSTFVCASGDHILAKGNTKFEIKRETAKRSQLLSDILSFDEKLVSFESFKLPANASTFEAWVTHVENREHLKRKSISYYSRVQQLLKAVAVADFVDDPTALDSAIDDFGEVVFNDFGLSEVTAGLHVASANERQAKRNKLTTNCCASFESLSSQASETVHLHNELWSLLTSEISYVWFDRWMAKAAVSEAAACLRAHHVVIPMGLLPVLAMRLPAEIRPHLIRTVNQEMKETEFLGCPVKQAIKGNTALTLPHIRDDFFAPMISAAASIDNISSINFTINCDCCEPINGCCGHEPGCSESVRHAMYQLAETDLTSFSVHIAKTSRDRPTHMVTQDQLCHSSFICSPCISGITDLTRLSRLELCGFGDPDDTLSQVLPYLKQLRILALVRCGLRCSKKLKKCPSHDAWVWSVPDALKTLGTLEELNLSSNQITLHHFRHLTSAIMHLPLRTLTLAGCGLCIWRSLSRIGELILSGKNSNSNCFSMLTKIDMSDNRLWLKKAEMLRPILRERVCAAIKHLKALAIARTECPWNGLMKEFLEVLSGVNFTMEHFSVGLRRSIKGKQKAMRQCLRAWPCLQSLHVDWRVATPAVAMLGKSAKYLADLGHLQDLHLGNVSVGRKVRETLMEGMKFPLTRLVLTRMTCSGRGAAALAKWFSQATSLKVLNIIGVERKFSDRRRFPHAESELLKGMQGMTSLTDVHVAWFRRWSMGGDTIKTLESVLYTLPQLHRLEIRCPHVYARPGFIRWGNSHRRCRRIVKVLRYMKGLKHLSMKNMPLSYNAGCDLANSVNEMKYLTSLKLEDCMHRPSEGRFSHVEIRNKLPPFTVMDFNYIDETEENAGYSVDRDDQESVHREVHTVKEDETEPEYDSTFDFSEDEDEEEDD